MSIRQPMRHIVMMSGGLESYAVGKIVAQAYGTRFVTLLFADTRTEDHDLYRFLPEAARDIGAELRIVTDGRNIWEVFRDVKFLGNTRIDPCSRILKREKLRSWLDRNCGTNDTTIYLGYRHDEDGRITKCRKFWEPWKVMFPLATAGIDKCDIMAWMRKGDLIPPALYDDGFNHNNCGGGCVKMGIGQAVHLLTTRPDTFAEWEENEAEIGGMLEDKTILRDRRGGKTIPMSLKVLRERYEAGERDLGRYDNKACNCFAG